MCWCILHSRREKEKVEQQNNNFKKNVMNTEALLTMLITQGIVISFAGYFFYRVLTTPPKQEPDSFSENDNETIRKED